MNSASLALSSSQLFWARVSYFGLSQAEPVVPRFSRCTTFPRSHQLIYLAICHADIIIQLPKSLVVDPAPDLLAAIGSGGLAFALFKKECNPQNQKTSPDRKTWQTGRRAGLSGRMKFSLARTSLVFLFSFFGSAWGIESPQFTVVHSESDFEIRYYRESEWMTATVRGISFEKATKEGFHRLYQYLHGANSNSSQFVMTSPILTSIIPGDQSSEYVVKFYFPGNFHTVPPAPLPELNLQLLKWGNHCVAVRKFSGFARDKNIGKEADSLLTVLGKFGSAVLEDNHGYTIAQYNASFHLSGRLNEVWINVVRYKGGVVFLSGWRNELDGVFSMRVSGWKCTSGKIAMTAPVLTSIVPGAGPLHSSAYAVRFYLPAKFQSVPPTPLPELDLHPVKWAGHCIAVRKFSGFAGDGNIVEEAEKLGISLSRSPWAGSTTSESMNAYSIAQYNSPFRIIGRVNEVWVDIVGLETDYCRPSSLATY
ncbi:hypothetical protein ACLOJK_001913 [Asimina triloba]